jgi:hypothetical protein
MRKHLIEMPFLATGDIDNRPGYDFFPAGRELAANCRQV